MSEPTPQHPLILLQPTCPWCGHPPMVVVTLRQAACGNDDCKCLFWDPTKSAAQNMEDPGYVDLHERTD